MVTTTYETQLPALTDAITNGIEVFMYDVAEANQNQAGWWNSVAHFCNNIIDSVKSCGAYMSHIIDVADTFIQENTMPVVLCSAITISLFFLWLDFIRGR